MTAHPAPEIEDLRRALRQGSLHLRYQPKISLATSRLVGVEALARWFDPKFGQVSPAHFIPMAESSGLIHELTKQVVTLAACQGAHWIEAGLNVNIAVNVSAANLADLDFPDKVEALCAKEGFPCRNLTIELTESATQSVVQLLDTLTRLRIKGMQLSIDDFGTGFSSLVQLHQLPYSELKIDKSFVLEMNETHDSRVIVESTINLAQNLSLRSVAEGVETLETLRRLANMGCNIVQGYYIAHPMAPSEFAQWARDWQANPARRSQLMGRPAPAGELQDAPGDAETRLARAEIMVVSDRNGFGQILRPLLERCGLANVNITLDGNVALRKLREWHCDLILVDHDSTPMDGPTLLRIIRADPRLHKLPLIMIMESPDPALIDELKAAGMTYFLTKPIAVSTLRDQLSAILTLEHGSSARAAR